MGGFNFPGGGGALQGTVNSLRFSGVRSHLGANVNITNDTIVDIVFLSDDYDTDNYHQAGFVSGQNFTAAFTAPYRITANIEWAGNATGIRRFGTQVQHLNASTTNSWLNVMQPVNAEPSPQTFSTELMLTAGEIVRFRAYQNCGTNLAIPVCFVAIHLVGAVPN